MNNAVQWKTMLRRPKLRCGKITTEAVEMGYNLVIADKFRGGYEWRIILAENIHDNGNIRDGYRGR